jgi:hypothetical protein
VYAREHRVPVAVARATLERDERHAKWRDAVRVVTLGLDLSTLQAVDLLENAGRLPTDDDVRRYLREEGKAAPGRLHGPTLWEPSAIYPWMQLLAADLHEEERTPNAWMENRPRGYWLGVLLRRLQDAA